MAIIANKRSVMTLYSGALDIYSHQVRIVLAEKGVTVDVVDINLHSPPEEFMQLNPYGSVPTLIDRDLVLFQARIINEYLDERFPHPPLMPVYPVARAKCRLMMYRIERDWYTLAHKMHIDDSAQHTNLRKDLRDSLMSVNALFAEQPYFLSEEFTLVDCTLGPLLWRLPLLGVELPAQQAKAIKAYGARIFARDTFQASLTDAEREIAPMHA